MIEIFPPEPAGGAAPVVSTRWQWRQSITQPIRAFQLNYVPVVVLYFAYGALGLIDVTRDLWIKESLSFTPSQLAGIGIWLTLPWTVKMVFGELVDTVPMFMSSGVRLGPARDPKSNGEASMTTFDKREEGFEKQFAHDEELKFKASARRNKLLGLWAAEMLGFSGAQADAYAKEVVMADFEEPGDDDVFRKIRRDFDAKAVNQSDHQIRRTMDELMASAVAEVKKTG